MSGPQYSDVNTQMGRLSLLHGKIWKARTMLDCGVPHSSEQRLIYFTTANPPYLLTIQILSPSGQPVPYATFDFWQANSTGWYYQTSYRLRGVFKADAEGKCQILTVIPGAYGFTKSAKEDAGGWMRAGHFHIRISAPQDGETKDKELERLTTQIYVCRKNDPRDLSHDLYVLCLIDHNWLDADLVHLA